MGYQRRSFHLGAAEFRLGKVLGRRIYSKGYGMIGFLVIFLSVEVISGHCSLGVQMWAYGYQDGNPLDEGREETCLA